MGNVELNQKELTLQTKRWGTLQVDVNEILYFPRGIPGFDDLTKFAIFESGDIEPFKWLISVEKPDIGFVIIQPQSFFADYNPKLYEEDLLELKVEKSDELVFFTIITLAPDPLNSTANLQGPLLINLTKRTGKQIVVVEERYTVKHPILSSKTNRVEEREAVCA